MQVFHTKNMRYSRRSHSCQLGSRAELFFVTSVDRNRRMYVSRLSPHRRTHMTEYPGLSKVTAFWYKKPPNITERQSVCPSFALSVICTDTHLNSHSVQSPPSDSEGQTHFTGLTDLDSGIPSHHVSAE